MSYLFVHPSHIVEGVLKCNWGLFILFLFISNTVNPLQAVTKRENISNTFTQETFPASAEWHPANTLASSLFHSTMVLMRRENLNVSAIGTLG